MGVLMMVVPGEVDAGVLAFERPLHFFIEGLAPDADAGRRPVPIEHPSSARLPAPRGV
jgi:hypothetical protein